MIGLVLEDAVTMGGRPNAVRALPWAMIRTGFWVLAIHRFSARIHRFGGIGRWLACAASFFVQVMSGCHVDPRAVIGRRVRLPHAVGIVIGSGAVVGDGVTIYQQVTLGSHGRRDEAMGYPRIGDDVVLFAGAVVVGGVAVGSGAIVGAHAVVLSDVPPGSVAIGIPAACRSRGVP